MREPSRSRDGAFWKNLLGQRNLNLSTKGSQRMNAEMEAVAMGAAGEDVAEAPLELWCHCDLRDSVVH